MKHWYTWIWNTTSITDETLGYMNIKHYKYNWNIDIHEYQNYKYNWWNIDIHEYQTLQVYQTYNDIHEYQTLQV